MLSGSLSTVCVLLTLTVHVAHCRFFCPQWCCKGPEVAQLPPYPKDCEYPPNGWWNLEHWYPSGPCRSTLEKQALSRIFLHRVYDSDVYLGAGNIQMLGLPFVGFNPVDVMVFYNNKSCTLTGTLHSQALQITDSVAWTYDAPTESLDGWYVNGMAGTLPYNTRGWMNVEYDGLQECMPASLAWVVPPAPEAEASLESPPKGLKVRHG